MHSRSGTSNPFASSEELGPETQATSDSFGAPAPPAALAPTALFGEPHHSISPDAQAFFGTSSDPMESVPVAAVPGDLFGGSEVASVGGTPGESCERAPPGDCNGSVSALFGVSGLVADEDSSQPRPQAFFGDAASSTSQASQAGVGASMLFGNESAGSSFFDNLGASTSTGHMERPVQASAQAPAQPAVGVQVTSTSSSSATPGQADVSNFFATPTNLSSGKKDVSSLF